MIARKLETRIVKLEVTPAAVAAEPSAEGREGAS